MKRLTSATAIGMILASTPALAEVTPKSVWDQLSGYYENFGLTVETASVEEAGDTLTVKDLVLSQTDPETGATRIDLGDLVLTATGDGGVRMDMADEAKIAVTVNPPEDMAADTGEDTAAPDDSAQPADDGTEPPMELAPQAVPVKFDITAKLPNEDITIHEDGAATLYNYLLPTVELNIDRIESSDGSVLENPAKITLTNTKGSDRIEGTKVVQSMTAEQVVVDIDVQRDTESGKGQITFDGLAATSETVAPADAKGTTNLAAMLKTGFGTSGQLSVASAAGNLDMTSKGEDGAQRNAKIKFDVAESSLNFGMNQDRLTYSGKAGASNFEMNVPDLPGPVGYGLGQSSFNLDVPVSAGEQPQPFTFSYLLDGVTLSDTLWSMFDPQQALQRVPAKINIDLAGTLTLFEDMFAATGAAPDADKLADPNLTDGEREAILAEMPPAPVALDELTINQVALDVMGATADVTGKLSTPGGDMAQPVGTISGKFTGVNALMDKLGTAGLIPQEQMMGLRMMLAMFSKADPQNPDQMTTELEFKEGGQIFANGQQVK